VSADGDVEAGTALVVFTTSNRPAYVRRCLPHLARACLTDRRLALLVALDGDDPETRAFCTRWEVPLLYSDAREGVGLSKNRVLTHFSDYDYYFFLEDDVEVLDGSVFQRHIELMRASGIQHMSLFEESDGTEPIGETVVLGRRIVHFRYGSAEFNAFTQKGLERVGGWHALFARYRRWGHTEHSWRFPRNGLAPAPFNVAVELSETCIRHRPKSVTAWKDGISIDSHGITTPERELMQQELRYVPLSTIAAYHVSGPRPGQAVQLAAALDGSDRYPLLRGAEHREATADFLVWRSETLPSPARRILALLLAGAISPRNIALRHAAKLRLLALRSRVKREKT
jgi:hypothetical protein